MAPSGLTADARRAGAIPNSTVTVSVNARLNAHRAPVEIEHQSNRLPDLGQQRDDERRRPPGEEGADDRCTDREQRAFDEHQLDETPAPGANRHAQRHLASASDGLSSEQIGDIRAGDQQHEHDEPGEDEQRKTECTLRAGCSVSCGVEEDLLVQVGGDEWPGCRGREVLDGVLAVSGELRLHQLAHLLQ